jgi:hypothetical protein
MARKLNRKNIDLFGLGAKLYEAISFCLRGAFVCLLRHFSSISDGRS